MLYALFISGVNPIVTKKDLSIILNNNNSEDKNILFNCCVYYEKKSRNTQTNSIEANKWLIKNDIPGISGIDTRLLTKIIRKYKYRYYYYNNKCNIFRSHLRNICL